MKRTILASLFSLSALTSSCVPTNPPVTPTLTYEELAEREALRNNINPHLIKALIKIESNNNPLALSHAGAVGLMQVMPANASRCNVQPGRLLDPETNIRCGTHIFAETLHSTKMDVVAALETYNGGPHCVNRCQESIRHARLVLSELAKDLTL